jgi:hypothetical protein
MTQEEILSLGRKTRIEQRKVLREGQVKEYYKNPEICKNCHKIIEVKDYDSVAVTRKKKFCCLSCVSTYSNLHRPKKVLKDYKVANCQSCGTEITWKRCPNGNFSPKKYCDECLGERMREVWSMNEIANKTKGEIKAQARNKQLWRTYFTSHSHRVYFASNVGDKCEICGYPHHVVVCHVKPIASFPDEAKVSEINSVVNLVGLCPNCHWELDHGLLEDTKKELLQRHI